MIHQPVSFLTQSKFYSPAFNAAIFDGPLRIYFAQYQEALALKVYFKLQEGLEGFRASAQHVFVMLYPTPETFENCFTPDGKAVAASILMDQLGDDHVVGVCGPVRDEDCDGLYESLTQKIRGVLPLLQKSLPVETAVEI